jgi:serine/threonine protein kinase
MIELNIYNFPDNLKKNKNIELIFEINEINQPISDFEKNLINEFGSSKKLKKNVEIIKFIGEGSYGKVYKVLIDNKYFALKITDNEIPEKLIKRYLSLISDPNLINYIIKIYSCGNLIDNKRKYFTLMEYGGVDIRKYKYKNKYEIMKVIKQLYELSSYAISGRHLLSDFKGGNLIVDSNNLKVKLIDIYIFCEDYPCKNCKVVKTYPIVEIEKEYKIYENPNYNFTSICIPLAIILIDLCCNKSYSTICNELNNEYNMDINVKQMTLILQFACYNYNNDHNNNNIRNYKRIYKFKKSIEDEFDVLSNNNFYKDFFSKLNPIFLFSKKKFILLVNDLFSACPEQRSTKYLKKKIDNFQ